MNHAAEQLKPASARLPQPEYPADAKLPNCPAFGIAARIYGADLKVSAPGRS